MARGPGGKRAAKVGANRFLAREKAGGVSNPVEGTVNAAGDAAAAAGDKIKDETAKAEANDKK